MKAFWFSKKSGQFVTSRFYYKMLPDWAIEWNRKKLASRYAGKSWELLLDPSKYVFGTRDDRSYETALPGFGRTFPHPYGARDDKLFTTLLTVSPAGDELVLDFANSRSRTKYWVPTRPGLFVGQPFFTDYVGHFGPSSLESEATCCGWTVRGGTVSFVDEAVGLIRR